MNIIGISLWKLPLTSHTAYLMADGKTCDTVESVILCIDTEEGIRGWGEVCPIPHYLPAYADGVLPAVRELAPVILGEQAAGPEALMARMDCFLPGHVYAKSAIDLALWDILGKRTRMPVYELLGGRRQDRLPLYHSITCIAPDDMVRIAAEAKASGIRQIQVKLGASGDWQTDVERLLKVRETVGQGILVYGDWNCGATRLDAIRVARAVAHHDIMLEQPCASIEECAAVKRTSGLPMKLDENAHDTASLLQASTLGCLDAVAIKLSKFGGLSKSRQARDLCCHLGARMCIEDTWGSDIVTAASLHLGAATSPKHLLNVCDLSYYVHPRLDANMANRLHGTITPPEGAGLGVTPDEQRLGEPLAIINRDNTA